MRKFIGLIVAALMLSACATNQRFDCKQSSGIKCQSLSEIDRRVTSGEIGQYANNSAKKPKYKSKYHAKPNSIYISEVSEEIKKDSLSTLRTKEEVAEIWIAAYETKEGIYHQPNRVHTVLKPSKWIHSTQSVEDN